SRPRRGRVVPGAAGGEILIPGREPPAGRGSPPRDRSRRPPRAFLVRLPRGDGRTEHPYRGHKDGADQRGPERQGGQPAKPHRSPSQGPCPALPGFGSWPALPAPASLPTGRGGGASVCGAITTFRGRRKAEQKAEKKP